MSHSRDPRLSRRSFLQSLGVGAGAVMLPGTVQAAQSGGQLATMLDLSKCIACEECVHACREVNGHKFPEPEKPFPEMYPERVKVEDFSERRDETDRLTPYNWLFIQTAEVRHNGKTHTIHVPRRCMHCVNAPCANLCPFGAAGTQPNGITRINPDICFGGAKCRKVCPWHIPQRQTGVGIYRKLPMTSFAGNGVMYKCDRCHDRVAQGELPACIEVCPVQLQTIGPRDEILAAARALARETGGHIYGADENGGTNTFYVSPVPFGKLNQAIAKGKGRPHLKRVENAMENEENLATAVAVAPLAGIVAGLYKAGKLLKLGRGKTDSDQGGSHE